VNINAARNTGSLEAFLKLVQTARVRNGGFDTPVGRLQAAKARAGVEKVRFAKQDAGQAVAAKQNIALQPQSPVDTRQVLGTRFDAYA
jgi:hypothetical protein